MPEEISIETKGRGKYTKRMTFTIRIDDESYAQLLQYMSAKNISKSKAVRELLLKGAKSGY